MKSWQLTAPDRIEQWQRIQCKAPETSQITDTESLFEQRFLRETERTVNRQALRGAIILITLFTVTVTTVWWLWH
ncbi:MAG: hypothetical protein ACK4HE_11230 [Chitinophagaceae bacterium]